jgi:hypothetical protein
MAPSDEIETTRAVRGPSAGTAPAWNHRASAEPARISAKRAGGPK